MTKSSNTTPAFLTRAVCVLCAASIAVCLIACGLRPDSTTQEGVELKMLGKSYLKYEASKGVGPPDADAWAAWAKADGEEEYLTRLITDKCRPGGKYVFYWGVRPSAEPDPKNTVLGYHKHGIGYHVLFCDGVVPSLHLADFDRTKKPQPVGK